MKSILKKTIAIAISAAALFSAAGCHTSDEPAPGKTPDTTETPVIASTPKPAVPTEKPTVPTESGASTQPEAKNNLTLGQANALKSAEKYLSFTAFSHDGLIEQLEYEGYTKEEATYAADNCGADWKEEALASAESYLNYTAFSYSGLIEQLEYEGFTNEEATYGADHCGADWMEQAALSAESYMSFTSFSRQGLIEQLEYEGFTHEEAVYGVEKNGY